MKFIFQQRFYFSDFGEQCLLSALGRMTSYTFEVLCVYAVDEGSTNGPTCHLKYQNWDRE
jgi:hypothetical protein